MGARLDRVVGFYARYGPARLPLGERRDVGGGYSMAAGVLAGGILWPLVIALPTGSLEAAGVVLSAVPVYLATGFVVGTLAWRYVPSTVPYYGAVAASVTNIGNYLVGTAVWLLLAPVYGHDVLNPYTWVDPPSSLAEYLGAFLGQYPSVTLVVVVWTVWVSVPLSVLFGHVYERSREAGDPSG